MSADTAASALPARSRIGAPVAGVTAFSPGIHGARGLFASLVVVFHVANSGLPSWPLPFLLEETFQSFKFGVELFFAISGFVIAGTMLRSRTPLHFIVNRATRIFPVLWAALIVFVPVALAGNLEGVRNYAPLELALVFVGNMFALGPLLPVPVLYGVAWTLGYEFAFYWLCFIYLAVKRTFRFDPLIPIVAAGLLIIAWHPRALFFIPGILVAAGYFTGTPLDRLARQPLLWVAVFLACWQGMANEDSPFFNTMFDWGIADGRWPLGILAFIAATLAVQGIANGYSFFGRFLQTPVMMWLGTISYSLYLWHPLVIGITKAGMYHLGLPKLAGPWSQVVLFCLAAPAALIVAQVSQWTLERGLTQYLRKWTH